MALNGVSAMPQVRTEDSSGGTGAPEMSLLALNATGELRYLGPSSGSFFSSYVASIAGSYGPQTPAQDRYGGRGSQQPTNATAAVPVVPESWAQFLGRSFVLWILPLFPLLSQTDVELVVGDCVLKQGETRPADFEQDCRMVKFYLVMALGAVNSANTQKQVSQHRKPVGTAPSASELYDTAISLFERRIRPLRPSLLIIEILLLICIYCSYGPSGLSQWQLVGLAMRMAIESGLHCSHRNWQLSEADISRRCRVFWTGYIIETTLAYNLGRPPSISAEHITARLPDSMSDRVCAILHIKHRRIQNQIISSVYCTNPLEPTTDSARSQKISMLQSKLDCWRAELSSLRLDDDQDQYPKSYWERLYFGTAFVLHRASPLCPEPSVESMETCIRCAGSYIDQVLTVLRESNVPLTWMLIQGVLFAGLTMLVTVRTNTAQLLQHVGAPFLFIEVPNWTRKCSICMAIMNERWNEDLLLRLDSQFEILANDTTRRCAAILDPVAASDQTTSVSLSPGQLDVTNQLPLQDPPDDSLVPEATHFPGPMLSDAAPLNTLDPFGELLGFENWENFWKSFPSQSGFDILDSQGADWA